MSRPLTYKKRYEAALAELAAAKRAAAEKGAP